MREKKYIFGGLLLLVLALVPAAPASAQDDIEIKLSLDRTTIGLDEMAVLTVTISANSQQELPEPKLPPLPQFKIIPAGSSTNLISVNNAVTYSASFQYVLSPKKEGTYPIRAATALVGGKRYESNEASITVVASAAQAVGPDAQKQADADGTAKDLFLVTEVDKKTAYVDEQVTLYVRYYRAIKTMSSRDYTAPQTPDFWSTPISEKEHQYYQTLNGRDYLVIETRTALFPTKPGELSVSPARLTVVVPERSQRRSRDPFGFFDDVFQQGREVHIQSLSLTVTVKPLPVEGKSGQFSGGVGRYRISSAVDKTDVEVNEAITLTVKISGTGNVKSIPEPQLPELENFRVERGASDYKVSNIDEMLGGTKTFEYLLIPRQPGTQTIQPLTLNYFDPDVGKYKDVSTSPIELVVEKGEGVVSADIPYNMVSGRTIDLNETDIRFIKLDNGTLRARGRILLTSPVFLAIMALQLVVVLGGFVDVSRKRKLANDVGYARQRRATAEAKKRLKKAESCLQDAAGSDFYAELSAAVYQYIADKFNVSAHGLTNDGVSNLLMQRDVSAELRERVITVLTDADFGRFAGAGNQSGKRELLDKARITVTELEGRL